MKLSINGSDRDFPELDCDARMSLLIDLLHMKPDRIAIERNGEIIPRGQWEHVSLTQNDRLEIVQFVGGGI